MAENTDTANVAVNNSEIDKTSNNGLNGDLTDLKKDMLTVENKDEISEIEKPNEVQELNNDTGSLLKQLDDALDELDKSNDEPEESLLEEDKLLEEIPPPPEPENDITNDEEGDIMEQREMEENTSIDEEIDDSDLKIIDEVEGDDEDVTVPVLSEEPQNAEDTIEKTESDTPEISQTETQMDVVEETSNEPETVPSEDTPTKVDEKPNEDTIVLESDDEETNETVINKELNASKRASVDEPSLDLDEPPNKRARSSPNCDVSSENEPMDVKSVDDQNDKDNTEEENLLVVAGGNRRRSETELEIKSVEKRTGSPIEEDCDSLRQPKISRGESVDSTSEETKMDSSILENDEPKEESTIQENGDLSLKQVNTESKTEPLVIKNVELEPKPDDSCETEEKHTPLSVEFLKTFKKSFHLMSRSDLEDFVLQKIVESIINKSEVSELRQKNESQEQTIANQRQRINDLAKQFRDLEMVHNRVTKDLETKSTGLVTPVKITRAVGLQVSQPRPKTDFRPMYPQPNQRVPPFPSRSPQRPNMNAIQTAQRMNVSLRQSLPQNSPNQYAPAKTSPIRPIGQATQNTQAKMIAMQKQQALQRQHTMMQQQQRVQPPGLQRSNTGPLTGRSPIALGSPGPQQRPPTMLNSLLNNQQPRNSPVVLRKIVRPGPASVQQAQMQALQQQQQQQQQKSGQNKFIDLTDEEEAARSPKQPPVNVTATKIHVKSPATLNSSVTVNHTNGLNRNTNLLNSGNPNKLPIQRLPGNKFVQIPPKIGQNPNQAQLIRRQVVATVQQKSIHPAPLPIMVNKVQNPSWKRPPPRPQIRINNIDAGIVISWTIHEPKLAEDFDPIVKYQIYAYQETNQPPATESWRHVGDVKAMALPMAVTLTQFQEGQRYHFAVRAVDEHERAGAFSVPRTWDEKT